MFHLRQIAALEVRLCLLGRAVISDHEDGSAGDADYGKIGGSYSRFRQPEPAIEKRIWAALGDARTVLNIGAGAGSYEPIDRDVVAVEPSASMREQRAPSRTPAIDASAEDLPFADKQFDASMATFTVHQWRDMLRGLDEMRRVTRGPVVILTCDPDALDHFWLHEYALEVTEAESARYPKIATIAEALGGAEIQHVPIPFNCRDGFNEAYYGRPEQLLVAEARLACSGWSFVPPAAVAHFVSELTRDLSSGEWDRRYGHFRRQAEFDGPLRLIVAS
ncbi:class I SAM-dependent methyltransferase [Sandaracinobacter sp. RS1-74]|uniref:class I SAM-dependent methyltransferase n=1 Tax=Sandaracinobacteroides sayramensis TaxID=2913411 RepID=UPI001EDB6089|nr:class I SAM-dependent methyltransferase [Sandaracinobacteroides sayramensis]MCG2839923.1 class I SAM-dependent methyltransferase [Sandaracinobacteroides sayramensis]